MNNPGVHILTGMETEACITLERLQQIKQQLKNTVDQRSREMTPLKPNQVANQLILDEHGAFRTPLPPDDDDTTDGSQAETDSERIRHVLAKMERAIRCNIW